MMRAETIGTHKPTTIAGALLMVDALQRDNERLREKLSERTAELDNQIPARQALLQALVQSNDLCAAYKAERDGLELVVAERDCTIEGLGQDLAHLEGSLAAARDGKYTSDAKGSL